MKRPMCVIGLSLALTTWVAFFFSPGEAMQLSLAAALTGILTLALYRQKGHMLLRIGSAACLCAAVAFALHARYEVVKIQPFLRADGDTVLVEGLVQDGTIGSRVVRYTLSARFPDRPDLPAAPMTLRAYGEMEFVAGDVIRCEAVLRPKAQPESGLRLAADNLVEGTLHGTAVRLDGDAFPLGRGLIRLRERMRNNVYRHLRPENADVVTAMVLGMNDRVGPDIYTAVSRSGTIHLLSVSGLHLSILTALLLRILERARLSRRVRSLIVIGAAFGFSLLVGLSASIVRAFVMTAIALAAGLGRRRADSLSSLGLAAAVISLCRPGWLLGRGFWLSAGSTLGILLFADPLTTRLRSRLGGDGERPGRFASFAASGVAVTVAAHAVTFPFLVVFFGWFPLLAPLSNLLVTPFVPLIIVCGILCAAVGSTVFPMGIVAWLADFSTAVVVRISRVMAGLPFATISLDQNWMLLWLGLGIAVTLLLVRYRNVKKLVPYGICLLVLSFGIGSLSHSLATRNTAELVTIEGCDAAVLLRDRNAVILGTPAYYEAGRLLRYLEFRNVRSISVLVAPDCGEQIGSGLLRLGERYSIDCILGPDDAYIVEQISAAMPGIPVFPGGYARMTVLDGVRVSVTVPEQDIVVETQNHVILKTAANYGIIPHTGPATIALHPDGAAVYSGARGREAAPLGHLLFGETRFRLRLPG